MTNFRQFLILTFLTISISLSSQNVKLLSADPSAAKSNDYMLIFSVEGVTSPESSKRVWVQHVGQTTKDYTLRSLPNGTFQVLLNLDPNDNKIIIGNAPYQDGETSIAKGKGWNWVKVFSYFPEVAQGLEIEWVSRNEGEQAATKYDLKFRAYFNYNELKNVRIVYTGQVGQSSYEIFDREIEADANGLFSASFGLTDEGKSISIINARGAQPFNETWNISLRSSAPVNITVAAPVATTRNASRRRAAQDSGSEAEITVGKDKGGAGPFDLSGVVVDGGSNFTLPGANVFYPVEQKGYPTDIDGRFNLTLPKGTHLLEVSFVGYQKQELTLIVKNQGAFTVRLKENSQQLDEVIITAEKADQNIKSASLGKEVLSISMIEALPPFIGEVDVLKSLTLLPGISTVGEASSGFNVRGGGTDQNLILLGGTTLYNPSHFFGFFSSFNSDLVKDVTVYKGGIPAKYGGRASSIIDITYKDGDFTKWNGKITVGIISTKVSVDGPLIKDRLSLVVGGRMSYANWLLSRSKDVDVAASQASFWDGNIMLNYRIADDHSLKYSFYSSFDDFSFASDTTQGWTNQNQNLTYNGKLSEKLFTTASLSRSEYDFKIRSEFEFSSFELKSSIVENGLYADLEYVFSPSNSLTFGVQTKEIEINPGDRVPLDAVSSVNIFEGIPEQAVESGIFIQHNVDVTKRIRLEYGLRYADFNYRGPKDVYTYAPNQQRIIQNIIDTTSYANNESIIRYGGFEPRASLRYSISETSSIKLGFNRIQQFIHLVSNTAAISPTDVWKLSDQNIAPVVVDQYSAGIFKNFSNNTLETSIEGYYKNQEGIVEYKDGAELFLNNNLETELVSGIGRAYGVEVYVKKKKGKSTGWVSYTYSRSERKVIGSFPDEIINNGEWFVSNFDRPHDLTAVLEHRISPYVDFSAVFTYSTGRPATFPVAKFRFLEDEDVAFFQTRNGSRGPDNHRLDLAMSFRFNAVRKIWRGEWKISLYNAYGRQNPFSVFFDDLPGRPPGAFKLSVLGNPFFSASYTLKL